MNDKKDLPMIKKAQMSQSRPFERDFVYRMAAPFSFLDIFAYLRLSGLADANDALSLREDLEFFGYRKWSAARSESA